MQVKRIIKEELIGRMVTIVDATNKSLVGMEGKILDETKSQFVIKTQKGEKIIMKHGTVFQFKYNGKKVNVAGELLASAPEERIRG